MQEEKYSEWKYVLKRFSKNVPGMIGLVILVVNLAVAISAPYIQGNPNEPNTTAILQPPSSEHPFGTDYLGRDYLTRIIWGGRVSFIISSVGLLVNIILGVGLGLIAAWYSGLVDDVLMRTTDIIMSFPEIFLAIFIMSMLGRGTIQLILVMGIMGTPIIARFTRGLVYSVKPRDYILSARTLGIGDMRIVTRHILPNILGSLIVTFTLRIAMVIVMISGLSFIGLGPAPPTPDWGLMLSEGFHDIRNYPHLVTFPGLMIVLLVLGFNLLGDGLRDSLDPRLR